MSDAAELVVAVVGASGRLTLNRPRALHALTTDMCKAMIQALLAWRDDPAIDLVLLDHAGDRGFCAGGDIRAAAASGAGDGLAAREFFRVEYQLNALMFGYPKPIVAVGDGVVMGGGAGLFLPCRYRIATERTLFAMPETGIGLFPDVGGGWYLPRLPGASGIWLGLTGARLKAADCLFLGLATHVIDSADADDLKTAILAAPDQVDQTLATYALAAPDAPVSGLTALIDATFDGETVEAIFAALKASPEPWAKDQLESLKLKSPQSLKVTLRHLRLGALAASFTAQMATEYRLAVRSAASHDFSEGVRAVLVDKDNAPHWRPATLDAMTDTMVEEFFAPLTAQPEWTPLA